MSLPIPKSPQGKPFSCSFSALNQFETCPAQYAAQRFYGTTKSEDTAATIWGTRVHKALENRVLHDEPLGKDFQQYEKYASAIIKAPGITKCEYQMAFDIQMQPVDWFAPTAWVRGVADVLQYDPARQRVNCLDYKTGKIKDDDTQLKMFACFASILYPDAEEFNCKYIWLKFDQITGAVYKKEDVGPIWGGIANRIFKVMECWETQNFPCRPSGLCRGWCPVSECIHYREKG